MKLLLSISLLFSFNSLFSQQNDVVFDRPGIADGPYVVNEKKWQLEAGFSYAKNDAISSVIHPSVMLRKRINRWQELRITYNYLPQSSLFSTKYDSLGYLPIALGTKIKLVSEKNGLPEIAGYLNTFFPVQELSHFGKSGVYNVELGILMQNNLSDRFSINYNVGAILTNLDTRGMYNYSFCVTYTHSDKLCFFAEQFSYLNGNWKPLELSYDFGVTFNPRPNQQIDLSYVANHLRHLHYGSVLVGYSIEI